MSAATRRNAAEVAYAREKANSTLCCWFIAALAAILVIGVFATPAAEADALLAHHPPVNDDDDNWPRSHKNDDDDDDDTHRHRHLSTAAAAEGAAVTLSARSLKTLPEIPTNSAGAEQMHENVLKTDYLGSHPRFIGCKADSDHIELRSAAAISLQDTHRIGVFADSETQAAAKYVPQPSSHIEFDEESGMIRFTVDVPYISMDAAYLVSFEPFLNTETSQHWKTGSDLLHSPGDCQSAPKLAANAKYADAWAHPPSALYNFSEIPHDVTKRGGAYATANGWKIIARSCSQITYQWTTRARDLSRCTAADGKSLMIALDASKSVAVVSGSLWLNLLWPTEKNSMADVSHVQWVFPFSIYVDTFESKMSIIDSTRLAANVAVIETKDEKIAAAQKAIGDGEVHTPLELQMKLVSWRPFTTLVHTWFAPELDVENFAPLLVEETEEQENRAMRMVLRLSVTCTSPGVFDQQASVEQIEEAAKITAPVYKVFAISKHSHAVPNGTTPMAKKLAAYGDFTATSVNFVSASELIECSASKDEKTIDCHRNLTLLLLPRHAELYQGSFDVYLCTDKCDIRAPEHVIHVEVAVTDPSADMETVEQLQIGVSSHLNSAAAEQLSEAAFDGGDRICMQSYAIGPQQLTQSIDLRTISAWVCTDNSASDSIPPPLPKLVESKEEEESIQIYLKSRAEPASGCTMLKHFVQLYGSEAAPDASFNVTLHEPGSYGSWSSAICFNTSSAFVDSVGNSVHRPRQYYQTEVVAVPTEKRRHMLKADIHRVHHHRSFASFSHAAHTLRNELHHDSIVRHSEAIRDALSEKFETLTSPELGRMLRTLDSQGRITRFNSITFDVTPQTERERKLHNVHESSAVFVVALIFLCGCMIAVPFVWLLLTKKPPAKEQPTEAQASLTGSDDEM